MKCDITLTFNGPNGIRLHLWVIDTDDALGLAGAIEETVAQKQPIKIDAERDGKHYQFELPPETATKVVADLRIRVKQTLATYN